MESKAESERKREVWHKTCMIPISEAETLLDRKWRLAALASPIPSALRESGLCSYCKTEEATHKVHYGNLLSHYMVSRSFCSPECLQGAILRAIFEHNLTGKRFLSLITKD